MKKALHNLGTYGRTGLMLLVFITASILLVTAFEHQWATQVYGGSGGDSGSDGGSGGSDSSCSCGPSGHSGTNDGFGPDGAGCGNFGGGGGNGGGGGPVVENPVVGGSPSGGGNGGGSGGGGAAGPSTGGNIVINEGDSATLNWSCRNSSSSSGVNFSTGGVPSGSAVVTPPDTTTYTIVCSNGGQGSIIVTVLHPVLTLTANPERVRRGNASTLTWSTENVNTCSLTGPGVSASGTSGSQSTGPVMNESTYTLSCQNQAGSKSESATVTLAPSFEEI